MATDRGVTGVVDLVDELEAVRITGLPAAELSDHLSPAESPADSGDGGADRGVGGRAWFTRDQCEAVGLGRHRPGDRPGYWLSLAQAATVLGVSRQAVYKMPLPTATTGSGQRVVRAHDVALRANARAFRDQQLGEQHRSHHQLNPSPPPGPGRNRSTRSGSW